MQTPRKNRSLDLIAKDYFDYLGRHLPQQCASDEFYFLPRSEVAIHYLDRLDDLRAEKVQDHIRYVHKLLDQLRPGDGEDLEEEIDRLLLKQSMESFVREFDHAQVWRHDPTLYVKIPLFATDQILSRGDWTPEQVGSNLATVFDQIPSFLGLARENLSCPSEISVQVAQHMVEDAIHFFEHDIRIFLENRAEDNRGLLAKTNAVLEAWKRFKMELPQIPARKTSAIGEAGLKAIFSISLGYSRSPREILEIAQWDYQKMQEKIVEFEKKIQGYGTGDMNGYGSLPPVSTSGELLRLYQREVEKLRRFLYSHDVITFPPGEKVTVVQTPAYMQSLRATASYRAPLTGNTKGHGVFYITPGAEDLHLISKQCPYLSAHETYPGHHILDHIRIHHSNPIRRQIESPLVYEGWACYGEQLLNEFGYIKDPRQQIIHLKRLLWRSMRAVVDVEFHTGRIKLAQGAEKMNVFGFSEKRVQRQIQRFALTPGYQSCYFMGMYEITRLREQFSPRLGLKAFHDTLLGGGQLPFQLIRKRLEVSGVA